MQNTERAQINLAKTLQRL